MVLPGSQLAGLLEIIGHHGSGTLGLRRVILVDVVREHAVGSEVAGHLRNGVLDIADPLGAAARGTVYVVVGRSNVVLQNLVNGGGVQFVLEVVVVVGLFNGKSPAGAFLVAFHPPAIQHGEVHGAVHGRFFAGSTGGLLRTGRIVHPHIHALDHALSQRNIVAGHKHDLADETGILGNIHNLLDQVLTGFIGRMGLTREEELHRLGGIVHNLVQTVQVAEQQRSALIRGKTTGEADGKDIVAERFHNGDDLGRAVMVGQGLVLETLPQEGDELFLQQLLDSPDILVRDTVDAFEAGFIVVMGGESRAEHLGVDGLPLRSAPSGIVHTVGHITHEEFLRQITRIHVREDILRNLAVQHGNTVHILRDVGGQVAHGEFLVAVQRIVLTQGHEGLPVNLQTIRIMADILAQHTLVEGIVTGGNRCMGGEQRTGLHHFQGLAEVQVVFLDVLTQTLQADESGMAFVAVVHLGIQTQLAEGADTAHTQQEFLLETVLPVAAIEVIGNLAVFLTVGLIVGVHQVKVGAAHFHLPQAGGKAAAGESHRSGDPFTVLVQHGNRRDLGEVLGIIIGHLITLGADDLVEITITVQQTHRHQVGVHVGGFLQIVTGQDTQTAAVNLQGSIQTVFHAEIGDGRVCALGLGGHIGVELVQYALHASQEFGIL